MGIINDILDRIRDDVRTAVGVMMIALLLVGVLFFGINSILPQWQIRRDLIERIDLAEVPTLGQGSSAQIQAQIDQAQAILVQNSALFLTEVEAAALLDSLYRYADESGVTINDLQAQPSAEGGQKSVVDLRLFRLQVDGGLLQLLDFVTRIRETAVPSVNLLNLLIEEVGESGTLSMDLALYTSPYAAGDAINDLVNVLLPTPIPQAVEDTGASEESETAPTPTTGQAVSTSPADNLAAQIHELWALEDWPAVIEIIDQLLIVDPNIPEIYEKLYAARVNNGYGLLEKGDNAAARFEFELALAVRPNGGEALAALQSLESSTISYEVLGGDTLFSIATQHGVTVDALRQANGLNNNDISPGQLLIIP